MAGPRRDFGHCPAGKRQARDSRAARVVVRQTFDAGLLTRLPPARLKSGLGLKLTARVEKVVFPAWLSRTRMARNGAARGTVTLAAVLALLQPDHIPS